MICSQFILLISIICISAQKISGDAGMEDDTVNQNPFNIPTINWEDILKNIPTVEPIALPTLDPNFWQNLPTIPPIVLPTIDPMFWNNLPTIPPIVLPTINPDFWKNFPTISPIQWPTLDANFWKNLNLPTLPPLQIPTLDPNFWKNLPTIPPFVFPTPAPRESQCTYKLSQELQNNATMAARLNYMQVEQVLNRLLLESTWICNGFQTQKLTDLTKKYAVLQSDMQTVTSYFSTSDLQQLLLSILQGDTSQVFRLFFSKTMENLANSTITGELSKASTQLSMLQFDLAINTI
ncbi:DUF148 domain-containing protein [Caenorhabditis elegans]|uniref:DUF148 domain-containing protein n=1 Tax=Caenorhabditis elegans TaxID=6239 RepID=O01919_CAEEL|nr:DUF148 domain-containing protein [Caenorhabditis elegans]CCD69953.1 DUF148 domain-containing protein [Caenorhabditis elegans]|eukprot:NP_497293.2 Uncharacterized protein CELE_F23H11.6 [Caenorhabditis elegans]